VAGMTGIAWSEDTIIGDPIWIADVSVGCCVIVKVVALLPLCAIACEMNERRINRDGTLTRDERFVAVFEGADVVAVADTGIVEATGTGVIETALDVVCRVVGGEIGCIVKVCPPDTTHPMLVCDTHGVIYGIWPEPGTLLIDI